MNGWKILFRLVNIIKRKIYAYRPPFYLSQDKRYSQYDIGDYTYGKPTVLSWGEDANLKIGRFCSIASDVKIFMGGGHRTDWVTTYPFSDVFEKAKGFTGHPVSKGDVVIGHDVWIATDVIVLSGAQVDNGAVLSTRSIITSAVPPYAIVAGNPARIVRYRFDDKTIAALLDIEWWYWPINEIEAAWHLLLSSDIRKFIETYKRS